MLVPRDESWVLKDTVTEVSEVEVAFKLADGTIHKVHMEIRSPASVYFNTETPGILVIEHGETKAPPASRI